jgi:hypothetical protein
VNNHRIINFKYILLDNTDTFKKQLYNVESCSINYSSLSRLKSSANIKMKEDEDIDYLNDRIQPIVILNNVEYPLGVFLICSPSRNISSIKVTRDITCYSKLQLLDDDKVLERHFVPAGTNVINEIIRLLGTNSYSLSPNTLTTSTNREWEIGTPKLDIINDLLATINYISLLVDNQGKFTANPYVLPTDRVFTITYEEGFDSILIPDMIEDFDLFSVPNIFVRYSNNPDINPPLRVVYENNNPSSVTSTVKRKRPIVDAAEVTDVADLQTLTDICKKDAYNSSNKYTHLEFKTGINPVHGYLDCLWVKCGDINAKYIETSWNMDLKVGGKMNHVARRVIEI